METLAEGHCFFAGAGNELVVDGKGNVHEHSICGHWLCVNAGKGPLATGSTSAICANASQPSPRPSSSSLCLTAVQACGVDEADCALNLQAANTRLRRG